MDKLVVVPAELARGHVAVCVFTSSYVFFVFFFIINWSF